MSSQTQAYLFTLLAVLFWSTCASAFKCALTVVSPQTLVLGTTILSTLVLFVLLFLQGKLKKIGQMPLRCRYRSLLLGVLNPFLYYLILFKAYALLPGQIAMALNYGWPLVLTLLSVPLLKQRLNGRQLLAVFMSFIGAVMIATQGKMIHSGSIHPWGTALAIASTLIWALFWLFNAQDDQDPVVKLFLSFCSGLFCIVLWSLYFGRIVWPPLHAWVPLVYIALFEMSLTFILWLTALQHSSSTAKIGNLMYLTPFFSLLCLHLVVGEEIQLATCIGLVIIISSILYQARSPKRAK